MFLLQQRHTHYDCAAYSTLWKHQKDSLEIHVQLENEMSKMFGRTILFL